jgi:hypothetical protein
VNYCLQLRRKEVKLGEGDDRTVTRNHFPSGKEAASSAEVTTSINRHTTAYHTLERRKGNGENGICFF